MTIRNTKRLRRVTTPLLAGIGLSMGVALADDNPHSGVVDDGLAPAPNYSAEDLARFAAKAPTSIAAQRAVEMSAMGAMAAGVLPRPDAFQVGSFVESAQGQLPLYAKAIGSGDIVVHGLNDIAGQAETTIAANPAGTILIAGYNDGRGFGTTPVSLSGVARSEDGGLTWAEVPVGPGGAGTLPGVASGSVYGDPDVKWSPDVDGPTGTGTTGGFVYSSIFVRPGDSLQGMSVHTSDANGLVWSSPKQVTPAFIVSAAADKEFIDVDPVTGRILITWTNFPNAGGTQILSSFSDDGGTTWSTASTVVAIAPGGGGVQASMPKFGPGNYAYVVYRQNSSAGLRTESFAVSTDDGATWGAPVQLTPFFTPEDQIQGIDRVNTSPSMAVNLSNGDVYVVYQRNNSRGTGDIAFQRWLGGAAGGAPAFEPALLINSDPGFDRAQFYPAITVDQSSGAIHVMFNDMDPADTGDLMEVSYTRSTNRGASWTRPTPLNDRTLHAGYGNDTSQPNLGDYMQGVAFNGVFHSLWATTDKKPQFFDGQPTSASLFGPDAAYDARPASANVLAVRALSPSITETACNVNTNTRIDSGETIRLSIPLENYTSNLNNSAATISGVSLTLSTATPGVTVTMPTSSYPSIPRLGVATNAQPLEIQTSAGFIPGTDIELVATVNAGGAVTELPITLRSGSPGTTTVLFSENFDAVTPPALPAGWSTLVGGGSGTNWTTSTLMTASQGAFVPNLGSPTRFMRLLSPIGTMPAGVPGQETYLEVEFDLTYNLEYEPANDVLAYDGLTVRLTDQTSGAVLRSVLAEAFATEIKTDGADHFPKHLPRNNSTAYFQDMSVWSGYSNGTKHVRMLFPGAGIDGRRVQLRFEYTEDSVTACAAEAPVGATCGAKIDNVVMRHVVATSSPCVNVLPTSPTATGDSNPPMALAGSTVLFTVTTTPGTSPASTGMTATVNLTQFGGSAAQVMYDDGSNGDLVAGDGIFSLSVVVPPATPVGAYVFAANATDAQARSASTSINFSVVTDNVFADGFE